MRSNSVMDATMISDDTQTPRQKARPVRGVISLPSWDFRPLLALTGSGEGFSFGDEVDTHDDAASWC